MRLDVAGCRELGDGPADGGVRWARPLASAERACCCPARPLVVVVMPPSSGRPYPVDLLLCGHHYRASLGALLAARAAVYDQDGVVIPPEVGHPGEQQARHRHIEAERREEEKREGKGCVRHELRHGQLSRALPLPGAVTGVEVTATYKAVVFQVRIPEPKREPARRVAISKA